MRALLQRTASRARRVYNRDFFIDAFLSFSLTMLAGHVLTHHSPWHIDWNMTASLPRGLYLGKDLGPREYPQIGQIACFKYEPPAAFVERSYFATGSMMCKPIVAVAGMQARQDGQALLVSGWQSSTFTKIAHVALADSKGRPVTPFFDATPRMLLPGEYLLVAGAKPNSLDSRYLGVLRREQLVQTVRPLLTWN